jgi:Pin2-interacting protein X1
MAEILGIPVSQIPTPSVSGSASPAPTEVIVKTEEDSEPKRDAERLVSTSTMSVSDYFRQKLREKALARQAATGIAAPLPDMPAPDVKPSSEWEGSKVKFEEDNVKLETLGGYELTAPEEAVSTVLSIDSPIDDERAAKKARKAARAAKKEAKEAIQTKIVKLEPADHAVAAESSRDAEKAAKKAAKEQRKLEKAEKKRKRED